MTSNYDRDVFNNRDLINALNEYQGEKVRALTNDQQGEKVELIRRYTNRGVLVALANGLKLKTSRFSPEEFIYMEDDGFILDDESSGCEILADVEYTEYIEPKQKQTYYRAFYRLKNSNLKLIYSTSWHPEESDIFQANYEIVETETREF